jgi:hypothetical protein
MKYDFKNLHFSHFNFICLSEFLSAECKNFSETTSRALRVSDTRNPYVINLFKNMFFVLIRNNMRMNDNVLEASHKHKVKKVGIMLRVSEACYSKDFQN